MKIIRFSASSMLFPEVVASSSSEEIICVNDLIRIIKGFGTSITNECNFHTHKKENGNVKNSKTQTRKVDNYEK